MFFAGVQLLSLGIIGEYLGRMYEEMKGRPLYLVSEELGIDGERQGRGSFAPQSSGRGEPHAQ
jgi:hypothetical protein